MTKAELVACVEREIRLRQSVYPRQVQVKKMTPAKAASEINAMLAVRQALLEYVPADREPQKALFDDGETRR